MHVSSCRIVSVDEEESSIELQVIRTGERKTYSLVGAEFFTAVNNGQRILEARWPDGNVLRLIGDDPNRLPM